jgi:hypothetical protein
VLKISTTGRPSNQERFGAPVRATFAVDQIRSSGAIPRNIRSQFCLGRINSSKKWDCHGRESPENSNGDDLKKLDYDISMPGTYAVILRPAFAPNQKADAYTGMLTKNKPTMVFLMFWLFPLSFCVFSLIYWFLDFMSECETISKDRKFLNERKERLADVTCYFRGFVISDQIKGGVDYIENPMHGIIGEGGVEG